MASRRTLGIAADDAAIRFYRATGEWGFLSNLYRCPVRLPERVFDEDDYAEGGSTDRVFRSSEDAYQYSKPRKRAVAEWLIAAPSPHLCAAAAHALFSFDIRSDWATFKLGHMRTVLRAKFDQHADLKLRLLETGDRPLIEESRMDAYWGVGGKGTGKNMLGVMLSDLRSEYRQRAEAARSAPSARQGE